MLTSERMNVPAQGRTPAGTASALYSEYTKPQPRR
jgi:hypothetical protein